MKGLNPCSGGRWGTVAQGSGPGELVLERFGDVERQLRRVLESHHASRGGRGFVRYCDSQNHAAQLQSYIHHDRTASDAGVGGHGRTLVLIAAQFLAFARAGSMQAAAKALRMHQSTKQRRVAELEERLGRRLVGPHGGGYRQELQPTPVCRPGLSLLSSLRAPLVL